jgi:predicted O-linked N-acetylglucosamine transferase (SPINDLY family)
MTVEKIIEKKENDNNIKPQTETVNEQTVVMKREYAKGEEEYGRKMFREAFEHYKAVLKESESASFSLKREFSGLIRNTHFRCAEILALSVGMGSERTSLNQNEFSFLASAIEHLERALAIEPFNKLAIDLYKQILLYISFYERESSKNIIYMEKILLVEPYDYVVQYNLGFIYHRANKLEKALTHYKLSYGILKRDYTVLLDKQKNSKDSKELNDDILTAKQFLIKVLNGIGSIYYSVQNKDIARYYFLQAYSYDNCDPDVCNQLAVLYTEDRITEKAVEYYKKGIENYHRAHISQDKDLLISSMYMNMGLMYSYECDIDTAIECYNKSLQYKPKFSLAYQNKLLDLNYISHLTPRDYITKAHFAINKVYNHVFERFADSPFSKDYKRKKLTKKGTKIVLGFVSGDFICHPVSYFISSVLDHIDYSRFEIHCFSSKIVHIESRFPNCKWHLIKNLNDIEVAKLVSSCQVDALFDLSGHTGDNRLDVFALKPAPIQINWIGYPNTTGLKSIDYRITDKYCDSEDTQRYHSEKLIFFPNCFLNYTPSLIDDPKLSLEDQKKKLPTLSDLPMKKNGYITFGCFNRFNKINDVVIATWVKILQENPTARFAIKTKEFSSPKLKKKFIDSVTSKDPEVMKRIDILGYSDTYLTHLPDYNKVDVALDTFPYAGTTTSCEALMMGVPILTFTNKDTHASNVTSSLLHNSQLSEFVCESVDEYVARAKELAESQLTIPLKEEVRESFMQGPVYNKKLFIKNFQNTMLNLVGKI